MRAVLHVLATIVVVPYFILATGFVLLGHSISSGSWLVFFDRLVMHAAWLVPWGLIAIAGAIGLVAVIGATRRFRRIGAVCLLVVAGASLAVIVIGDTSTLGSGQLLFLLPCICVFLFAGRQAVTG
jgi:hypothetical protein